MRDAGTGKQVCAAKAAAHGGAAPGPTVRIAGSGADATPVVQLEAFHGSLDLLLDLARRHAIDLATLSLRALVDQFVTALAAARHDIPLARRADWLVTATWFALHKAQLLVPDSPGAADAQQRATAARERLLEKARMQAAADWLGARRPQLGIDVFARGHPEVFTRQHTGDVVGLLRACLWLLRRPVDPPPTVQRPMRLWRAPEAIAHMAAVLSQRPEGGALLAFLPRHALPSAPPATAAGVDPKGDDERVPLRAAIASTLIAALELSRCGTAACDQAQGFAPIQVHAATGADTGAV
jgi:segregation and condensation protein A